MKRVLFLFTLIASFACLVLFAINSCGDLWVGLASLPFVIYASTAVHEAGHVLGCRLVKGKVYMYKVSLAEIAGGKLSLSNEGLFTFQVKFSAPEKSYIVYLSGIIVSILLSAVLTLVYFLFLRHTLFYIVSGATLANVLATVIYFKGTDLYKCFNPDSGGN
ncbi:MAG: hypothetical protein ACI4VK_05570 [Candidatus Coproplasma sp.]